MTAIILENIIVRLVLVILLMVSPSPITSKNYTLKEFIRSWPLEEITGEKKWQKFAMENFWFKRE